MAKIWGTNIDVSAIAGNLKGDAAYWRSRLENAENPNDVLFEMAYSTPFEGSTKTGADYQGQGQGNPNVGNIQTGTWRLVGAGDTDRKDHKKGTSWAEEHINSSNDVYIQSGGKVISMDPNTGKVLVNQKDSDGNWGTGPVGAKISGDQSGLDANMKTWLSGNAAPGGPGKKVEAPAQEQINLLEYRPWTQKYANKYMTGGADSLMTMDKSSLSPEYSIAYQPGEFRDPNTWAQWAKKHEGHIPEGAWRRATMNPASAANLAAGTSAYTAGGDPRQNIWAKQNVGGVTDYKYLNAPGWNVKALDASVPGGVRQASTPWDFTAPAHSQGNVAWQDWTPQSMNLTTPDSLSWEGLLKTIDTSPTISPGLLTTGKGGPISFDGK